MVILSNTTIGGNQGRKIHPPEEGGGAGKKPETGENPIRFRGDVAFQYQNSPAAQQKQK
jgi:hypothetical protein